MASDIDSIRTIYWFHYLALKLHVASALGVQRLIDPQSIKKDRGEEISHSSKWAEYKRGLHAPRRTTISMADIRAPGSAAVFKHVLWVVLKQDTITPNFSELLARLNPETQRLIYDIHGRPNTHASRQFLGKFERRASIDTLAALALIMKYNHEQNRPEIAWEYAHSIFRVLVILGNHLDKFGIANRLFEIFVERVFSLVEWNNQKFALKNYPYDAFWGLLLICMNSSLESERKALSLCEQARIMVRILREDKLDSRSLFSPWIRPI